ncbi:small multi-drug resistant family protein [Aestuariispira ectoiniformans]|uniref:small multi-drug resistant family protein n=1 Tax=Aestuariispira ectoiniformans TaxID=2775080 RepID=UPI00223BD485|nr:small multi-drug resistant family protein [Aestuariispira ectoiniformans]
MTLSILGLILFTVTLSACAQLALKWGVGQARFDDAMHNGIVDIAISALMSPMIWVGLAIYGLSVVMWLWVLSKVDLSVAYPFVGVSFLVTLAFGAFILNEAVTPGRILGTVLIAAGCILVGKSA